MGGVNGVFLGMLAAMGVVFLISWIRIQFQK
jgi:hypothetical protein